jgi:putative phosphoesterase
MRLAIISDLHADVHALTDALAQAERLGCTAVVCAGDVVDTGMFPQETIDLLIARSIPTIRGNHDRWAIGKGRADAPDADTDDAPRDAAGWDLSRDAIRFLAELPTSRDLVIDGVRVAVRHGTPSSDMEGIYPDQVTHEQARAWLDEVGGDVMVVGHTHIAFAITHASGGMIVNPGALLREPKTKLEGSAWIFDPDRGTFAPGPAPGGGTFGVLDVSTMRFSVHNAADGVEIEIIRRTMGTP